MTAGRNCLLSIWRWLYEEDDSVGGAVPTGTFVYRDVPAMLQENKEEQLLLQQGLEIHRTFVANIVPHWLIVYEGDEVEVIQPTDSAHYGKRFRVINIRYSTHNRRDPRGYIALTLTRSERSHGQQ